MVRASLGYTLIELLVTVSLVAILSAVAVPSYQHNSQKRSAEKAASSLQNALSLARQVAITRGEITIVCPSVDGRSCDALTTDWSGGGIAFVDLNNNGQFEPATEQHELIERIQATKNANTLVASENQYVRFNAFGHTTNIGSPFSIEYNDATNNATYKRIVCTYKQGRIRIEKNGC